MAKPNQVDAKRNPVAKDPDLDPDADLDLDADLVKNASTVARKLSAEVARVSPDPNVVVVDLDADLV